MDGLPGNGQVMEQGSDSHLMVRFHMHPVLLKKRSKEAGRPLYEDRLYINITNPGDRTCEVDRPATEADKQRFPRHFALFEREGSEAIVGTPLKEWPLASASQIKEWNALGIYSVEQLAGMTDANIGRIMDGRKFRDQAKRYLEAAKDSAATAKLQDELSKRDNEIATLQRQMAELLAGQQAGTKQAKRGADA